jgi:hypothetical protein
LVLIPPGQRAALTKPEDRARFAAWSTDDALPLFGASTTTASEPPLRGVPVRSHRVPENFRRAILPRFPFECGAVSRDLN